MSIILYIIRFLNAYDKKSAGTEKANTLIHFLQNHHPIIIK